MDQYLAPHTQEAKAHIHLSENWFGWDVEHPSLDETLVAGCASYRAFNRYLSGADLFILPRTRTELESILRRYAVDAIHNTISVSRSPLQPGGYSRVCHLAEDSIRAVLNTGDNVGSLLALHVPKRSEGEDVHLECTPSTSIRLKSLLASSDTPSFSSGGTPLGAFAVKTPPSDCLEREKLQGDYISHATFTVVRSSPVKLTNVSKPHLLSSPHFHLAANLSWTMARWSTIELILLLSIIATTVVQSVPPQVPLQVEVTKPRKLRGRFLQITDLHPDPYYTNHASQSSACHRRKPKKEKQRSNLYGTPFSECDSPLILTNFTLDFLDKHWASELDFVIWTGDNARHDNDRKLPRTPSEIYELNRAVASKMEKIFGSKGIPVIPSLGNNDVWRKLRSYLFSCSSVESDIASGWQNIMEAGPNSITSEFSSIWKSFIPFPMYQVFQRGGYFHVEVVPNALAVISLNTMYFYDSNKAVGGCEYTDRDDPGNLQFDWLEVQLTMFRERKMQVSHVPPSPGNYFPECYVRYTELALRFQDTIVGHVYGHMNADHFTFVEAVDLQLVVAPSSVSGKAELYKDLIEEFSALPKKAKEVNYDNYSVINVSPPVVPNPYVPTFRVFSYNVSEHGEIQGKKRKHRHERGKHGDKGSECKKEPYKNSWKCHLNEPWHSDPDSPSRRNQRWTPLGYAQYYLPNLENANKSHKPKFKLEYLTFPLSKLHPDGDAVKQKFDYPVPVHHLPRSLQEGNVSTSRYAPYSMEDLTIGSWVELARRLGNSKESKLRKRFKKLMYLEY
ncbi:hypothetical protein EYR36_005940 [Pleurotus pulmonarius]|nr:hypothetical protein EYR36_005940 [Pleurotus pulmonarius]